MVSLTSTSMFGQVGANSSARAYFLAESGYRYAESRYLSAATETARDNELETLHNAAAFTLKDKAGQFDLKIYPYFFKVVTNPFGTSTLSTRVPGGFPKDVTLSNGRLKIGAKATSIYNYNSTSPPVPPVPPDGQNITFNMTQTLPNFLSGADVLPVAVSSSSIQQINEGDSLQLQSGTGSTFPRRNGTFQVNNRIYAYKENDLTNNRLLGITDPEATTVWPLSVNANSNIVLQKFVKLHSTGIFGQGSMEGAADREVVYHVPLPTTSEQEKKEYHEKFDDPTLPNWLAVEGAHSVKTVGSGNVLMIDTPPRVGLVDTSLITFRWSNTDVDLAKSHQAAGYFLNYDAQVKIGFSPQPADWKFPAGSPFPELYVAGLSFRLDTSSRGYGVSFLRGDNSFTASPQDGLPNSLVPPGSSDVRVTSGSDDAEDAFFLGMDLNDTVLKLTRERIFIFDVDQAVGMRFQNIRIPRGATITNAYIEFKADANDNEATNLTFYAEAVDDAPTFTTGFANISSRAKTSASVAWNVPAWSANVKYQSPNLKAIIQEVISRDGWSSGNDLAVIVTGTGRRRAKSFEGEAANSPRLYVEYQLDRVPLVVLWQQTGSSTWTYLAYKWLEGFTIPANDEATLLVRVKEAAALAFDQGSDNGGGIPIEDGDVILGPSGSSVVNGSPIVDSGAWVGGTAVGTLTINNVSGSFSSGHTLRVVGSAATARVTGTRARDNYIKVYVGDVSGNPPGNDDPLDGQTLGNPRGVVHWPPDLTEDTDASNDYFTLIQWDAVNPGVGSNTAFRMGSGKDLNAIIRSNTFTTCTSCTFNQPELGLHAMGNSLNFIYFDDFAAQTELGTGSPSGFPRTIQE